MTTSAISSTSASLDTHAHRRTRSNSSNSNSICTSTRSRKHSAPVQIHALLRASTESVNVIRHDQGYHHQSRHRRGASLSGQETTNTNTSANRSTNNGVQRQRIGVFTTDNHDTPTNDASSGSSYLRQRSHSHSHSYASAPLSTLVTHVDSPSLASFTPADVHPCAAGSLRRCQWMLNMDAYGAQWYDGQSGYGGELEDGLPSANLDYGYLPEQAWENSVGRTSTSLDFATLSSSSSSPPSSSEQNVTPKPKSRPRLALPLGRLWKKISSPSKDIADSTTRQLDSLDDGHRRKGSGSDSEDGDDGHTPSLSPSSSRQSSRSRSSTSQSLSQPSPSNLFPIPSITRKHSGLGENNNKHAVEALKANADGPISPSDFAATTTTAIATPPTPSANVDVAVRSAYGGEAGASSDMAISTKPGSSFLSASASRTESGNDPTVRKTKTITNFEQYKNYAPSVGMAGSNSNNSNKPLLSVKTPANTNTNTIMHTSSDSRPTVIFPMSSTTMLAPPPARTLRSSKKRPSIVSHSHAHASPIAPSALPDSADLRIPFPTPSALVGAASDTVGAAPHQSLNTNPNPNSSFSSRPASPSMHNTPHPSSHSSPSHSSSHSSPSPSPTSSTDEPSHLLSLFDLERTSKLMRSTTTCAVCGRSGAGFSRCPRTGVAWCSRACRIAAKKNNTNGTGTGGRGTATTSTAATPV